MAYKVLQHLVLVTLHQYMSHGCTFETLAIFLFLKLSFCPNFFLVSLTKLLFLRTLKFPYLLKTLLKYYKIFQSSVREADNIHRNTHMHKERERGVTLRTQPMQLWGWLFKSPVYTSGHQEGGNTESPQKWHCYLEAELLLSHNVKAFLQPQCKGLPN